MADDSYISEDAEAREALVNNVLQIQQRLKGVIARVDSAKKEHESLLTENQMLQKYINNSLTSTAVFGATGGAVSQSAAATMVNKSGTSGEHYGTQH